MSCGGFWEKKNSRTVLYLSWPTSSGDGLYEGLTWLQTELTGKQVKKAVTKPIQETSDSVVKSGFFSSWFSSLSSYFAFTSTSVSDS